MSRALRTDTLFAGNVVGGQTLNVQAERGHINGLLLYFSAYKHEGSTITVKRETAKRKYVLTSGLALSTVERVSAVEFGTSRLAGLAFFQLNELLKTKAVYTAQEFSDNVSEVSGQFHEYMAYLPLGSLHLGQSSLDVQVNIDAAAVASHACRIVAVSLNMVPDYMYGYDVPGVSDGVHHNVDAIYLVPTGRNLLSAEENDSGSTSASITMGYLSADVRLEDDLDETVADVQTLVAATNAFENQEGMPISHIAVAYRKPDAIPARVRAKLTGDDAGKLRFLVRREEREVDTVSYFTQDAAARMAERIAKLEKENADQAKALRHAGEIPTAAAMAATAAAAEASNKADGIKV